METKRHNSEMVCDLFNALSKVDSLTQIINVGLKWLENPFFIRGVNFEIIGHSHSDVSNDVVWTYITKYGHHPFIQLDYLHSSAFMKYISTIDEPVKVIFSDKIIDSSKFNIINNNSDLLSIVEIGDPNKYKACSRVFSNIMIGKTLVGQLVVLEHNREFIKFDKENITLLSTAIAIHMQKVKRNITKKPIFDTLIVQLLDGIILESNMDELIEFLDWSTNDPVYLVTIKPKDTAETNASYTAFARLLENTISTSKCFEYNDSIVMMISTKRLTESAKQILENLLVAHNMAGGISKGFIHLKDIRKYYDQASKSIYLGSQFAPDKTLYHYDDYYIYSLLSLCRTREDLREYIHPGLQILKDYDKKNNTDYEESLSVYLQNYRQQSKVAGNLHIHRNSLNYRIKKIEEIINVDLSDMEEIYRLYLSYKILEYLAHNSSNIKV